MLFPHGERETAGTLPELDGTVQSITGLVKVFGQTVQSITKFNDAIKSYRKFALAYTMSCKKGMVAFNSVINSSFLVLVPTALIIGFVSNDLIGFMQSFLFYVIFSPACRDRRLMIAVPREVRLASGIS